MLFSPRTKCCFFCRQSRSVSAISFLFSSMILFTVVSSSVFWAARNFSSYVTVIHKANHKPLEVGGPTAKAGRCADINFVLVYLLHRTSVSLVWLNKLIFCFMLSFRWFLGNFSTSLFTWQTPGRQIKNKNKTIQCTSVICLFQYYYYVKCFQNDCRYYTGKKKSE